MLQSHIPPSWSKGECLLWLAESPAHASAQVKEKTQLTLLRWLGDGGSPQHLVCDWIQQPHCSVRSSVSRRGPLARPLGPCGEQADSASWSHRSGPWGIRVWLFLIPFELSDLISHQAKRTLPEMPGFSELSLHVFDEEWSWLEPRLSWNPCPLLCYLSVDRVGLLRSLRLNINT